LNVAPYAIVAAISAASGKNRARARSSTRANGS
jgi:hypothetical protein